MASHVRVLYDSQSRLSTSIPFERCVENRLQEGPLAGQLVDQIGQVYGIQRIDLAQTRDRATTLSFRKS